MFKPYEKQSVAGFVAASRLSDVLDAWPAVYSGIQKARLKQARHRMVGPDTRLVLEAYPRSGSSFAHKAFVSANPDCDRRVATHMHRSTQIVTAVRLEIPTLILIRNPREAVISLVALAVHNGQLAIPDNKDVKRCFRAALLRYAVFHERIADLPNLVVAGFDEVTGDFGNVISRVNAACGTKFTLFEHSDDSVCAIINASRRHASPNADRSTLKEIFCGAYDSPDLGFLRARSEAAFTRMLYRRDRQLAEGK